MDISFNIFACSGPGATAAIQQAITFGYFCAAAGSIITLALAFETWRRRKLRSTLPAAVIMMLIHPAWTVSARNGDCGGLKIQASLLFTGIFLSLMIFQYVTRKRST